MCALVTIFKASLRFYGPPLPLSGLTVKAIGLCCNY